MVCPVCARATSRMRVYEGGVKACATCFGLSETGGSSIDGTLTRQSSRIRDQQMRHEGDLITPHIIDTNTKQIVPNPAFMKRYPDKIATNYTQKELEHAGHSKVGKVFKDYERKRDSNSKLQDQGVTFRNSPKPV